MSRANPWKTLSSGIVYKNQWMQIREDAVVRPDGNEGIYAFLEKTPAVGVIALDEQQQIELVGQYRYTTERYSWELIEGGIEQGEPPLDAAKRELREEAGLVAQSWELLTGELQLSNCVTAELGYLFLARELSFVGAEPEDTEVLESRRVPLSEAVSMVEQGEITDGMSVVGILRVARMLEA